MNSTIKLIVTPFALALLLAVPVSAQLGGSLTPPPGLPAPGMKTLDQVEARTPLVAGAPGVAIDANGTITISQPGSYYLTRNLEVPSGNGIAITTDSVTIDLNGFRISSTANPASGNGIYCGVSGGTITICNGHIFGAGGVSAGASPAFSGSGFAKGINVAASFQASIFNVQVRGTSGNAIETDPATSTVVENCTVRHCGGNGIRAAAIRGCTVISTIGAALYGDIITQSKGVSLHGHGIYGTVVSECSGRTEAPAATTFSGIFANVVSNSHGGCVHSGSPRSITATIATSCRAAGTASITHKYNMP